MSLREVWREAPSFLAPAETSGAHRIVGFDVLRLLGALAVVWIHGCDTNARCFRLSDYAAFAVPGFLLMSAFLLQKNVLERPGAALSGALTRRLGRLLPAYLGWSAIYVLLRMAGRIAAGREESVGSLVAVLSVGAASYQLYYVAALVYLTVLFLPVMAWVARGKPHVGTYVGLVLLSFALWWAKRTFIAPLALPLDYVMLKPMSGLAAYMPLGMMAAVWHRGWRGGRGAGWPGVAACGSAALLAHLLPIGTGRVPLYAVGVFGAALCVPVSARLPGWVLRASRLSFGVYLVHAVFIESLQRFAPAAGFNTGTFRVTVAIIAISALGSFAVAAALCATRWTRWLVA